MLDLGALVDPLVDEEIRRRVDAMGFAANEYGYDRWGASPRAFMRLLALARKPYRDYFRVSVHDVEKVPTGRALLIANHSAQLAYDGLLIATAMALDAEPPRHCRAMVERFFAGVPVVNTLMQRSGQLIGLPQNAERLLMEDNALVLVFPEGARGGGKVFKDRYRIMGFGQGFLRLALRTNTPIVPVGFIGGEEMVPSFSKMRPVARFLGAPYAPLTPTILPLPLPTRCSIWFGDPLRFDGRGDEEDNVVVPMVREVEDKVAAQIARGLQARQSIF